MSKKAKLFGLLAVLVMAGAAWAALVAGMISLNGLDRNIATPGDEFDAATATTPLPQGYAGEGAVSNAFTTTVLAKVHVNASPAKTITLKPGANAAITEGTGLQLVAKGEGTVVVRGANNGNPSAVARNTYAGGTFVYYEPRLDTGTLRVLNNNSLGLRFLGLFPNATFGVQDSDKVSLGAETDAVAPVILATQSNVLLPATRHDHDRTRDNGPHRMTVNVGEVNTKLQDLIFAHGLIPSGVTVTPDTTAAYYTLDNGGARFTIAQNTYVIGGYGDAFDTDRVARLVKTGTGYLRIHSDGVTDTVMVPAVQADAFPGAYHTGGTEVQGGLLEVHGGNAVNPIHHYKGSLGLTWAYEPLTTGVINPSRPFRDNVLQGYSDTPTTTADGPRGNVWLFGRHNPLAILNSAQVWVNRSQFFSFFNTDAATKFTAEWYTLNGINRIPQISVWLGGQDSSVNGTLDGKFDLVLESRYDANDDSFYVPNATLEPAPSWEGPGVVAVELTDPQKVAAQYALFLNKAENTVLGETLIANGIMAVTGSNSIPKKGSVGITAFSGNLTIGALGERGFWTRRVDNEISYPATARMDGMDKAVFLAQANATVANRTLIQGRAPLSDLIRFDPYNRGVVNLIGSEGRGAVAALPSASVTFTDVTLNGYTEINPRAVTSAFANAPTGTGEGQWVDKYTYPTWSGTVVFGGAGNSFDITGDEFIPTEIMISRGTLQLNSVPTGTATKPFANVTLRESATLSLAQDVNDFSKKFDLKIDDDARIRVVVRPGDIAASRTEAMEKAPLFYARKIDYTRLGTGTNNKDRRLVIQLDLSQVSNSLKKGQWVKLVFSDEADKWNNLHYLRDNTSTEYEDYAKVRLTYLDNTDLLADAVAHVDENSYSILMEVTKDVSPTPSSEISIADLDTPTSLTPGATYTVSGSVDPTAYSNVNFGATPSSAISGWTYDALTGDFSFLVTMPATGSVKWWLTATDSTGTSVTSATYTINGQGTAAGLTLSGLSTGSSSVSGTVTYLDATGAPLSGKSVKVTAQKGTETPLSTPVTTGATGTATFTINGLSSSSNYTVTAIDANDSSVVAAPVSVTTKSSGGSGGGGGCDAGFAGLALLLAAPLFLRKKD